MSLLKEYLLSITALGFGYHLLVPSAPKTHQCRDTLSNPKRNPPFQIWSSVVTVLIFPSVLPISEYFAHPTLAKLANNFEQQFCMLCTHKYNNFYIISFMMALEIKSFSHRIFGTWYSYGCLNSQILMQWFKCLSAIGSIAEPDND
jgi:hypothetical protein